MTLKRLLPLFLLVLLLTVPANAAGYSDVKDGDWFAEAVRWCTERGLMNGTGNGRFSPEQPLTRAAAVTTLWRRGGSEAVTPESLFDDVKDSAWYAPAAAWAAEKELVDDGDRFGPDDILSREQLALLLWRDAGSPAADAARYEDAAEISPEAADAVRWARSAGVMKGMGENRFSPRTPLTRAQLAMVLMTLAKGEEETDRGGKGFTQFDSALIAFLEDEGLADKNYMVSPTSFRAALALATAGADGETKAQLLRAAGFASMDEVNGWYGTLQERVDAFAEELRKAQEAFERNRNLYRGSESGPDRAFRIANSVWHNADKPGTMSPAYIDYVKEHFSAAAADLPAAQLTDQVNRWVNHETNGLIPRIANDLSRADAVLVNALYLRTSWLSEFSEQATAPGDFTTVRGSVVQKDFMCRQDRFSYYEDEDCQLLVMPMAGGIQAAFVLGDASGLADKLGKASSEEVIVRLPRFEIETSLEDGELIRFLRSRGAELPFSSVSGVPDFSLMSEDSEWYISDIIQKSRIKTDEDGIEAAAVTAIAMNATTAFQPDPPRPKEFIADRPFTFCLYNGGGESAELLFFGQLVE